MEDFSIYDDQDNMLKHAEMVPLSVLKGMRDYNRRPGDAPVKPGRHEDAYSDRYEALKQHIAKHGITSPVWIDWHPEKGIGHISEGNHRIAAAEDLGLTHLPAVVYNSRRTARGLSMPLTYKGPMAWDGYEPEYMRPSDFPELSSTPNPDWKLSGYADFNPQPGYPEFKPQEWDEDNEEMLPREGGQLGTPPSTQFYGWDHNDYRWDGQVQDAWGDQMHGNDDHKDENLLPEHWKDNFVGKDTRAEWQNPMDALRDHLNHLHGEYGSKIMIHPEWDESHGQSDYADVEANTSHCRPITNRVRYLVGLHELAHLAGGSPDAHSPARGDAARPQLPLSYDIEYKPKGYNYEYDQGGYMHVKDEPGYKYPSEWEQAHKEAPPDAPEYEDDEPEHGFFPDDTMQSTSPYTFDDNKLETEARAWDWAIQHSAVKVTPSMLRQMYRYLATYADPKEIGNYSPTFKRLWNEGAHPESGEGWADPATGEWAESQRDRYHAEHSTGPYEVDPLAEVDQMEPHRWTGLGQPLEWHNPDSGEIWSLPNAQHEYFQPLMDSWNKRGRPNAPFGLTDKNPEAPVWAPTDDPLTWENTETGEKHTFPSEGHSALQHIREHWNTHHGGYRPYVPAKGSVTASPALVANLRVVPPLPPHSAGEGVTERQAVERVKKVLAAMPELRKGDWADQQQVEDLHPLHGHCYVGSEALYHLLGGKAAGYTPMQQDVDGASHWWLRGPNGVLDPTAEQFDHPVDYDQGTGRGFLTSQPSKRTQKVLDALDAKTAGADHAGAMVALMLKPEHAKALKVPGGEPAKDMHVTLVFFKDKAADRDDWEDLYEPLANIAREYGKLEGEAGGTGSFAGKDGVEPYFATPDVPHLAELHTAIKDACEQAGFPVSTEHGFNPHITLKHVEDGKFPEVDVPSPLAFDGLTLMVGGKPKMFKFEGENVKTSDWHEEDHPREGQSGKFTVKQDQHAVKVHDKKGKHIGTWKRCKHCGVLYAEPANKEVKSCPTCGAHPQREGTVHQLRPDSAGQQAVADSMDWRYWKTNNMGHKMFQWTDPETQVPHTVTGYGDHGDQDWHGAKLKKNMRACMNGSCAHTFPNMAVPPPIEAAIHDEPGAPVLRAGQEVTYGGKNWWVIDVQGDIAHIYDDTGHEDIVPANQLKAASDEARKERNKKFIEDMEDRWEDAHNTRDPDFVFVYFQGKLKVEAWDVNLRVRQMAEEIIRDAGFDGMADYENKLDNDSTSAWVTGEVWRTEAGHLKIEITQLADPDIIETAKQTLHDWFRHDELQSDPNMRFLHPVWEEMPVTAADHFIGADEPADWFVN